MNKKWFVIVNPTSGNGASKKKWPLIFNELKHQLFNFEFAITTHKYHAET
ncbi:diacylglycerol kinase family protein, partial [Lutibacter sp.]